MSAKERIAGDILEGAEFLKRGPEITSNDKVKPTLDEALDKVTIEWME